MCKVLVTALLLLPLINHGIDLAMAWDDQDFFKYCPPSQCSQHGPEIRYPFCLESSNTSSSSCGCGSQSIRRFASSGQDTILFHPVLGQYNVSDIDYRRSSMKVIPLVDPCLLLRQKLIISRGASSPHVDDLNDEQLVEFTSSTYLVCCSKEFTPGVADGIAGPVSCLTNATHFLYLVSGYEDMSVLPLDCKVMPVSDGGGGRRIPMYMFDDPMLDRHSQSFKESAQNFLSFAEKTVYWDHACGQCELSGGRCAFSFQEKPAFCMPDPHGSHIKVIAATSSVVTFFVVLLAVATALYLSLRTRYNEEIHLKVEMFLKTYGTSKPMRYTFSEVKKIHLLVPEKLLDIALGIARGIEYLHQGCNQRILHFDIKPHNILLDYNFNPKISDFGLAKLCARDQSIVTLTAARGTMGYIAPELYSQNFGGISCKSDVYSFGMLVLEMVSGRRNSDPSTGSLNDVYLPEWIYEKVINDQELALTLETTQEEKEKVKQLAIVALWCIQWNPRNRPSMTKVVNMLTGRLQNLQKPPRPFITSENQPMP
ncbi:hypothetical protein ACQ4PT_026622 [Festuca glaucescens]